MILEQEKTSRRGFLARGLGSAAGICALSALGPAALPASDGSTRSKMRFGLCTYQWGKAWNIPELIAHCQKAGVHGVEPRTDLKYAHGIELSLTDAQRAEVKKRFADSPVRIVSVACGERLDWPQPQQLRTAITAVKNYLKLSHDVGCDVLRVFPNQFHPGVPHEETVEQIARALNELGAAAADWGQELSLEAHGPVGELPTLRAIMDRVARPNVRVRLNCDPRDTQGKGFAENFALVAKFLSRIVHLHNLNDADYPYQLMVNLLAKADWDGWALMERSDKVGDCVEALIQQREIWESMVDKATQANQQS